MSYPNAKSTILMKCNVCSAREGMYVEHEFLFLDWQLFPRSDGRTRVHALYECPVCQAQQTNASQSMVLTNDLS